MADYKLVTKSSNTWNNSSGELRKLNQDNLYYTDNEYGFPVVKSSEDMHIQELIPFHMCKKKLVRDKDKTVHFFLDDYKFEVLWSNPKKCLEILKYYGQCISPTYSIWEMQPYALNLYNMYRSRWVTRYLQENDVKVLVDVRWAGKDTYDYCFSGIEHNSPVIVNTVGTKLKANRQMFIDGFEEMVARLEPSELYVYGEYMPLNFEDYIDKVTYFPSFWAEKRKKGV